MPESSFSEKLAQQWAALQLSDVPEAVVASAKLHLLDTIGCILAGSRLDPGKLAYDLALANGDSRSADVLLLGTSARVSCHDAALAMSVAGHCGEMDDIHSPGGVCVGAIVVPALLSLAQKKNGTGRRFLEALIAGYEMIARVALAIDGPSLFMRGGWWPSTVCGAFGVAAAGAKFLGWPVDKLANAIGIASLHAGGMLTGGHEGATARHLAFGRAAQNGLLSLQAAEQGFTGPRRAFEDPHGFCRTLSSEPRWEYLESRDHYFLLEVAFKPYPCARQLHAGVECLLRILNQDAISISRIQSIELSLPTPTASLFDRPEASTNRAALLGSGQFVMAVTAVRRKMDLTSLSDEFLRNGAVQDLTARVSVRAEPDLDHYFPQYWPGRVSVRTTDGHLRTDELIIPKGESGNPMSPAEIEEKFSALVTPVIGNESARRVIQEIDRIDTYESVRHVVSTLIP